MTTIFSYHKNINYLNTLQKDRANIVTNITTGYKYGSYSKLGKESSIANYTQNATRMDKIDNDIKNLNLIENKLDYKSNAIKGIADLVQKIERVAISYRSSLKQSDFIKIEIDSAREELVTILNRQFNGQYIFSGSKTNTQPINKIDSNTVLENEYQGNEDVNLIELENGLTLKDSFNANNPVISDLILTLSNLEEAFENKDTPAIEESITQLKELGDKLFDISMNFSQQSRVINNIKDQKQTEKHRAESIHNETIKTDLPSDTVKLENKNTQTQYAFSAISSMLNTKLLDYI